MLEGFFGIVSLRYLLSVSRSLCLAHVLCVFVCVCLLCVSMFQVNLFKTGQNAGPHMYYASYVLYNKYILFILKVNKIHPGF